MIERDTEKCDRQETDIEPNRETVTIIIDTLDHWPRELGSLDPDDPLVKEAKAKVSAIADKEIKRIWETLFPLPDMDQFAAKAFADWSEIAKLRRINGNINGVMVNGA